MDDHQMELDDLLAKLRPFQREGYEFAIHQANGRLLLADEMGLGKTVTSLAIMLKYKSEWPLLILCPASLRHTWPGEIEKFIPRLTPQEVYICKGFDDSDFHSNPIKRSRIKVVIATYSLLQNRSAAARVLQDFHFKCVIADESHNLKEKNSQRCQLAMPLLLKAKRVLFLSGTPALARPVELWPQLHCINQDMFGSYTYFTKTYCNARRNRFGWDVSGISNADELHKKLKQVMVRRLKADVLTELPPKQRSIVPVKIQKSEHIQECREIMERLKDAKLTMNSMTMDEDEAHDARFEVKTLLTKAYQASGVGKAQACAEYILDWLRGSDTQKVLVFAHHKDVMDVIEAAVSKHLKGLGHIRIDGSVSSVERAMRVKKFQTKPQIRVALLSVTAAGVGLTLTAASSVIFTELHWTPGVLAQAEDRCHRIGQPNAVNIMYCACKDADLSVDMQLWKMLGRKVGNLGRIIEGEKGLSLHADQTENSAPSEQELASFFAETCPSESNQTNGHSTVKGSIQSYFMKKSESSKTTIETAKPSVSPEATKQIATEIEMNKKRKTPETPVLSSWECSKCTYINQFTSSRNKRCEVCGNAEFCTSLSHISSCNTDVICLSDSDDEIIIEEQKSEIRRTKSESLSFSVSKNSGRVSIHNATGDSLFISFEIEELLIEHAPKDSYDHTSKRRPNKISPTDIYFDEAQVFKIVSKICQSQENKSAYFSESDRHLLSQEIKDFIRSFSGLREVEKQAIQKYGIPIQSSTLRETLQRIVIESSSKSQTDRYCGGRKEEAIANKVAGKLSEADKKVLDGFGCAWCGKDLHSSSLRTGVASTYCSFECAEEGRLKRGGMYSSSNIRSQIFTLESGICQLCHIDANAIFLRISSLQPAERLNALINAGWTLPKGPKALQNLLQDPKEGDFWQADHIKAVAEGGGGCGLENLRTLCTPCHQQETAKLRARLKLKGKETIQVADIRSFFSS